MEAIYLAIAIISIYFIFGPVHFFALYVIFDRFSERKPRLKEKRQDSPFLWTEKEVQKFFKRKKLVS